MKKTSKRMVSCLLSVMTAATLLTGCGGGSSAPASSESAKDTTKAQEAKADNTEGAKAESTEGAEANLSGTITMVTNSSGAEGLQAVLDEYNKTHPDVSIDFTIYENVTEFETMMTSWISSNSLPDMYLSQASTVQQQYAAEGYLMPLTGTGIEDHLVEGDTSLVTYDGKLYAFPMATNISVTICNNSALKDLGIELTVDNYPKSMDEFLALMQQCRDAGVEYPYGLAGADLSSCTAWPFQYMYQVLYGGDPNWYADVLSGNKDWSDPEFVAMFDEYNRIREYVSPDSLGKNMDGLYADFISGNTLFFSQVATTIKNVKVLDPESDIILIPSSFTADPADQTLISSFDDGISITANAQNPELCIDFLNYVTSPEGSTIYANATGTVSTVVGCEAEIDPSYSIVYELLQKGTLPNSPILSRQWIAGFKELLKSGCQNWLAGEDPQSIADTIAEEHKRLTDADPDWVANFLETYEWK
ncbi:MAG: extracellular solute-binding protein [Clostridiaceae bacterium]|nr:extracellular solute-binding protein [Clostridiaceae bacterium]